MNLTPEQLIQRGPEAVEDLIGKAHLVARIYQNKALANTEGVPLKLLLSGEPGCGKSAASNVVSRSFAPVFEVVHVSGCQVTAELVRDWILGAHHKPMAWVVRIIEEVDKISQQAEVLMLQYLDIMPNYHAMICTSNASMGELSDRFQSRFSAVEVTRPETEEVTRFLMDRWPELGVEAVRIAKANGGDVRASLNDAQSHLDLAEFS